MLGIDRAKLTDRPVTSPKPTAAPFLALRSMYVAPDNADTAELHADGKTFEAVGFGAQTAGTVRFGRSVPSRHNTSAPDISFEKFED